MILTEKEAKLESKKDLQGVGINLKEVSFCVEREKILDDLIKENSCDGEQLSDGNIKEHSRRNKID